MIQRSKLRRSWDDNADSYDRRIAWLERRFLADSRPWVCRRAEGETLELAGGTGLNLPHYPQSVRLTLVDWSSAMLSQTGKRARDLGRQIDLQEADVMDLPFGQDQFDAVVCTFSLCGVPDVRRVLGEAIRVLRPGGNLLLADHVAAHPVVRPLQHLLELITVPAHNEHFTRRPLRTVVELGLEVIETHRTNFGAIERVHARKNSR